MPCADCQLLTIEVNSTWEDNGFESDVTSVAYNHGRSSFVELETTNLTGTSWSYVHNGGLLARGDIPEITGDEGYSLTIKFRSVSYPVPVILSFDAVHYDEFGEEHSRATKSFVIYDLDEWSPTYNAGKPGDHEAIWMENLQILVAEWTGL